MQMEALIGQEGLDIKCEMENLNRSIRTKYLIMENSSRSSLTRWLVREDKSK